jgi:hypothetical protein
MPIARVVPGHSRIVHELARALGLGDCLVRGLTIDAPINGLMTVDVTMVATEDNVLALTEVIRKFHLQAVEPTDPGGP